MKILLVQALLPIALAIAPLPVRAQAQMEPSESAKAETARQEGDLSFKAGEYAAAIEAYGRAIEIDPKSVAAYKGRAMAHRRLHQPEIALQDYDQAIQLAPEDAEAYFERGQTHAALREFEAAIQDFDKAIEKKPDYGRAYSARGGAKSQSGDKEGARADWAKADSLGYSLPRRLRVGGNLQMAKLISQPHPVYPKKAKKAGISGVVRLNAVIGKDGTIQDLTLAGGDPLLVPAAMEAVKKWVYQPTLLDGRPVEVVTQIDVHFVLSH